MSITSEPALPLRRAELPSVHVIVAGYRLLYFDETGGALSGETFVAADPNFRLTGTH